LPKDSTFDLDRYPPEQYIEGPANAWRVSIDAREGETQPSLSFEEADNYRWIDWCAGDSWLSGHSGIAPFDFAPPDESIIAIPMKHNKDRAPREWTDEYRMMVQIKHKNKIPPSPPTALSRRVEMYENAAKIIRARQIAKSE
jgi:hypothetical protein